MKEAFAAGILVILTAVFTEFLKDLLENAVPAWSLTLCVLIASGVFCASACQIGFAYLGLSLSVGTWLMSLIVGLLCARHAPVSYTHLIRSVLLFFLIYFFRRSLIARVVPTRSRQQIQTLFASQILAAAAPKTAPPMNIPIIPK